MRIDRISSLRDYGIFRDFRWPGDLSTFERYNLIYGWNGSGKTLLSRLFCALGQRAPLSMGQASVCIDGNEVNGAAFSQVTVPVRVFNRDFVNESVFPVGGGDVPPIFVVGNESVEKQKEADRLKTERITAQSTLAAAQIRSQEAERTLDGFCQDRARAIKDALRSPGANRYNNYDKSDFHPRAQKMTIDGDAASHRLTDEDRDRRFKQIRSSPKLKLEEVLYRLPTVQVLANAAAQLLSTTVVSAVIQRLKDDPVLADWTRHGLGLHRDRSGGKCLFCEQPMPPNRLSALEAHFSAEYEQFLHRLDEMIDQLTTASGRALQLVLPKQAELYDDFGREYVEAERNVRRAVGTVRAFLDDLARVLTEKRARPFEALTLDVSMPEVADDVIDRLNEVVQKHNRACDEFQARVVVARDLLALDMIAADLDEFARLKDDAQGAVDAISPAVDEVQRLTADITQLEREILEHRRPAEELNEDLRKYLGHGELQLSIKDTGYSVTRNGALADRLSEGEVTAIALLYFLRSLESRDFDLPNGVVVLDDPVSSLDQNAMFAAFGYVRAKVQAASQVVILTHNFMFFRLVRDWFRNLRGQDKRAYKVYMLECARDGAFRTAKIRSIDPLLMESSSEYHYLFARIYRMATDPTTATLDTSYCVPSIARRVVETFLAFRVPDLPGQHQLWRQMQEIQFDDATRSRICRYMQTHAHRDVVGDADEDLTLLGESRALLNDVLDFMRAADAEHVSRMIARVSTPSDATGDRTAAGGV